LTWAELLWFLIGGLNVYRTVPVAQMLAIIDSWGTRSAGVGIIQLPNRSLQSLYWR